MKVPNCAKTKSTPPDSQLSITDGINASSVFRGREAPILNQLIRSALADEYGCARDTDGQMAQKHGFTRGACNKLIARLVKKGAITIRKEWLTPTYCLRRIYINFRAIRKLIGLPVTFGDRSKAKKRHTYIHFVHRKEKAVEKRRLKQEQFAFYGVSQTTMSKLTDQVRLFVRCGALTKQKIQFIFEQLRENGASRSQIEHMELQIRLLTVGDSIGLIDWSTGGI